MGFIIYFKKNIISTILFYSVPVHANPIQLKKVKRKKERNEAQASSYPLPPQKKKIKAKNLTWARKNHLGNDSDNGSLTPPRDKKEALSVGKGSNMYSVLVEEGATEWWWFQFPTEEGEDTDEDSYPTKPIKLIAFRSLVLAEKVKPKAELSEAKLN